MKIDKYVKDIFLFLKENYNYSSSSFSDSSPSPNNDDGDNNEDNNNEDDGSWFCIYCQKEHLEMAECRNNIYGAGDRWCTLCNKVHYNIIKNGNYNNQDGECPKGGKWCFYCNKLYVDEDEHFSIHEQNSVLYISFVKEDPSWAKVDDWKMPSWAVDRVKKRGLG